MIEQNSHEVSSRPHKFFERYLDNDLEKLSSFLEEKYKLIQEAELRGVDKLGDGEIWVESGSLSTVSGESTMYFSSQAQRFIIFLKQSHQQLVRHVSIMV